MDKYSTPAYGGAQAVSVWNKHAVISPPDIVIAPLDYSRWIKTGAHPTLATTEVKRDTAKGQAAFARIAEAYGGKAQANAAKAAGDKTAAKLLDAYKRIKLQLPAATPAGVFAKNGNDGIITHAGFAPLDIDGLPSKADATELRAMLGACPEVARAWVTLSERGVQAIVRIAPNPQDVAIAHSLSQSDIAGLHKDGAYPQVFAWAARKFGAWLLERGLDVDDADTDKRPIDAAAAALSHKSAVVHDPDAIDTHIDGNAAVDWDADAYIAELQARGEKKARQRKAAQARKRGGGYSGGSGGALPITELERAFNFIPVPQPFAEWRDCLLAARNAGLSAEFMEAWSAGGAKYEVGEVVDGKFVDFAKPDKGNANVVGAGSIIKWARDGGYETPGEAAAPLQGKSRAAQSDEAIDYSRKAFSATLIDAEAELVTEVGAGIRMMRECGASMALITIDKSRRREADPVHKVLWREHNGLWGDGNGRAMREHKSANTRYIERYIKPEYEAALASAKSSDNAIKARQRAVAQWRKRVKEVEATETTAYLSRVIATLDASAYAAEYVDRPYAIHRLMDDEIDADMRYMGCANGVVDLETAKLLTPDEGAGKFITISTGVAYKPSAEHKDVDLICALPSLAPPLRAFLLDGMAWALRRKPASRFYFLFNTEKGQGRSGKTTFMGAFVASLGDYASWVGKWTFQTPKNGQNTANPDRRKLCAPFIAVATDEVSGYKSVDNEFIKNATGGGKITYRANYQDDQRGVVTAAIFLSGNEPLGDKSNDAAFFERYTPIPFVRIPDDKRAGEDLRDGWQDTAIGHKARREAFLSMLIRRCANLDAAPAVPPELRAVVGLHSQDAKGVIGAWLTARIAVTHKHDDVVATKAIYERAVSDDDGVGIPIEQAALSKDVRLTFGIPAAAQYRPYKGAPSERCFRGIRWRDDEAIINTAQANADMAQSLLSHTFGADTPSVDGQGLNGADSTIAYEGVETPQSEWATPSGSRYSTLGRGSSADERQRVTDAADMSADERQARLAALTDEPLTAWAEPLPAAPSEAWLTEVGAYSTPLQFQAAEARLTALGAWMQAGRYTPYAQALERIATLAGVRRGGSGGWGQS